MRKKASSKIVFGALDVEHILFRNWLTARKDLGPGQRPVGTAAAQAIARFHQYKDLPERERPRMPCSWEKLDQRWDAFQASKLAKARKAPITHTPFKPSDVEAERDLPTDIDRIITIASKILSALANIEQSIETNTDVVQRNLEAIAKLEKTVAHAWGDDNDSKQT